MTGALGNHLINRFGVGHVESPCPGITSALAYLGDNGRRPVTVKVGDGHRRALVSKQMGC